MVEEHDEWREVEEEANVEHSPGLVNEAAELEEESAIAWVFHNLHRFACQVDFVLTLFNLFFDVQRCLNVLSLGLELHKSVERLVEGFADDLLDRMVYWESIGIHVIEGGHTCQSSVEEQNEEVACLTVDEDDGHELKDDSEEVLRETKNKSVNETDVPAVLRRRVFVNIVCQCPALEMSWVIHDILHSVEAVDELGAKRRVHVERRDHTWNQNPIIIQRFWRDC